jgi:hypothetical protein
MRSSSFGWLVGLATFAIYAALVPWMVRVWPRTGDEPHYLLAAHSLAFDGDFDLSNNYAQHDYRAFYTEPELNPHTRPSPRGEAVLTHNLGLSILLTPAYRFGGFRGVEYFLAALGALLAMNIFLLGYQLTGNWLAAGIGWLAISFTPPVLWYVFLVYPEMVASLCLLIAVRYFISPKSEVQSQKSEAGSPKSKVQSPKSPSVLRPSSSVLHPSSSVLRPSSFVLRPPSSVLRPFSSFILLPSSLFLLPWLSSRYLPVLLALIGWAGVRAWRERSTVWGFTALAGLAGWGAYTLFSLWLYGNASPVAAYAGPTQVGTGTIFDLIRFVRGVFGWLMDNQRGILVSAPVYLVAFWGGALLLRRRLKAGLAILAPFSLMLGSTALWGGFWIGWEYSARFVVAALPPLGAGIAYLWATGRRAVVIPITVTLLGLSVLVGNGVVFKPLSGLTSSPIQRLQPILNIEAIIPAMAEYIFVPAGHEAAVGEAGGLGWQTTTGQSGIVLRQVDLPEFSFGWYTAHLPLAATGDAPATRTPVATIKIFSPRWGEYFSRTVYSQEAPTGQNLLTFDFKSPTYDGWQFPPTVLVSSTGQANLSVGTLKIEPQLFHSLILPALWLIILTVLGIVVIALSPSVPLAPPAPIPLRALSFTMVLLVIISLGWSLMPQSRTHAAFDLKRTVGTVVNDSQAYQGKAIEADPEAGQEAGMLAATLPEIYAPGHYRLTVSLLAVARTSTPDPSLPLADVRLLTPDATLQHWEVSAADLPTDGRYHEFTFDFENPRQQALAIILDYPATLGFRADRLKIEPQ